MTVVVHCCYINNIVFAFKFNPNSQFWVLSSFPLVGMTGKAEHWKGCGQQRLISFKATSTETAFVGGAKTSSIQTGPSSGVHTMETCGASDLFKKALTGQLSYFHTCLCGCLTKQSSLFFFQGWVPEQVLLGPGLQVCPLLIREHPGGKIWRVIGPQPIQHSLQCSLPSSVCVCVGVHEPQCSVLSPPGGTLWNFIVYEL